MWRRGVWVQKPENCMMQSTDGEMMEAVCPAIVSNIPASFVKSKSDPFVGSEIMQRLL